MKKTFTSSRFLFLADSLGAFLSAGLLFFLVRPHPAIFGMPANATTWLAGLAAIFCLCSYACYRQAGKNWRILLNFIAYANLLYCLLTLALVMIYFRQLTGWGLAYFTGEIAVIGLLIYIERKTVRSAGLPAVPDGH